LLAGDRVRSDLYCDFDGNNCIDIADVNTGTSTGTNTPSGTASPAQWVDGADLGSNSNFEQICPAGEVLVGLRIQTIHGAQVHVHTTQVQPERLICCVLPLQPL
jgi:hypothetical protein